MESRGSPAGESIDSLLRRWGAWRNSNLYDDVPRQRSAMYTPGVKETTASCWQPCQTCYATGADLSQAGSGIKTRAALLEIAKDHPCPACRGRQGHSVKYNLADPAAIPSTGPGGMYVDYSDTPQEYLDIEAALDGLDEHGASEGYGPRYRAVIEARYVKFPRTRATQNSKEFGEKARVAWVNERICPDRISSVRYGQILGEARVALSEIFSLPVWSP